ESVGHPRKTRSGNARQLREVDMPPQVAAEHLIAAIATQDDLDVLARKLGYEIERKSGRNSERFVGVPRNLRQRIDKIGSEREAVVLGPTELGYCIGIAALVKLL